MHDLKRDALQLGFAVLLLGTGLLLASCCGPGVGFYTDGMESPPPPPGSRVESASLTVMVTSADGAFSDLTHKRVAIMVDQHYTWLIFGRTVTLLSDELGFDAGYIHPEFSWDRWDQLTVRLFEEGDAASTIAYSRALAQRGRRHLVTLSYRYDPESDTFRRAATTRGKPGSLAPTDTLT